MSNPPSIEFKKSVNQTRATLLAHKLKHKYERFKALRTGLGIVYAALPENDLTSQDAINLKIFMDLLDLLMQQTFTDLISIMNDTTLSETDLDVLETHNKNLKVLLELENWQQCLPEPFRSSLPLANGSKEQKEEETAALSQSLAATYNQRYQISKPKRWLRRLGAFGGFLFSLALGVVVISIIGFFMNPWTGPVTGPAIIGLLAQQLGQLIAFFGLGPTPTITSIIPIGPVKVPITIASPMTTAQVLPMVTVPFLMRGWVSRKTVAPPKEAASAKVAAITTALLGQELYKKLHELNEKSQNDISYAFLMSVIQQALIMNGEGHNNLFEEVKQPKLIKSTVILVAVAQLIERAENFKELSVEQILQTKLSGEEEGQNYTLAQLCNSKRWVDSNTTFFKTVKRVKFSSMKLSANAIDKAAMKFGILYLNKAGSELKISYLNAENKKQDVNIQINKLPTKLQNLLNEKEIDQAELDSYLPKILKLAAIKVSYVRDDFNSGTSLRASDLGDLKLLLKTPKIAKN